MNDRFQPEPAWINRHAANDQAEIYGNTGRAPALAVAQYIAREADRLGVGAMHQFAINGAVSPELAQEANDRIVLADEEDDMTTRQRMIALLGYIEAVTG